MPFSRNPEQCDQQVRLRFSRHAKEVIQYDMFQFGETKENTFINTLIRNFYEHANASINIQLNLYKYSLEEKLTSKMNIASTKAFISFLTKIEEKKLLDLASGYDRPDKYSKSKPYRLQNDIYNVFTDPDSDFCEEKYYHDSCPSYIKTLIEEYSRLPYIEREKIYFKPYFDIINEAVNTKKQLRITTYGGYNYYTLPHKILSDPLSTGNYLTGYSYPASGEKEDKYTVSYKISSIKKIQLIKSKSSYLNSTDISCLETAISQKGVQFLVSENLEIKVRFTEEGMYSFKHWLHLRPEPVSIVKEKDSYIAVFNCSFTQALAYFFKFGGMIEILSPDSLRSRFIKQYSEALSAYLNT